MTLLLKKILVVWGRHLFIYSELAPLMHFLFPEVNQLILQLLVVFLLQKISKKKRTHSLWTNFTWTVFFLWYIQDNVTTLVFTSFECCSLKNFFLLMHVYRGHRIRVALQNHYLLYLKLKEARTQAYQRTFFLPIALLSLPSRKVRISN